MPSSISETIRARAREEGFDIVRFTSADSQAQTARRLNDFIAKEKASGRFAELQKKWFGEAFPNLPVAFEPDF